MKQKEYTCICGRCFDNPQKFNGHKSNCKLHSINKYGSETVWDMRRIQIASQAPSAYSRHVESCKQHKEEKLSFWILEQHTCELCGKVMAEYYGSGRFCSELCARSFASKDKRAEINQKVSLKLTGRSVAAGTVKKRTKKSIEKSKIKLKETLHNKTKDNFIRSSNGDLLDITKSQLEEYRQLHPVCEICGNPETTITNKSRTKPNRLCVDHNHSNSKFRGLLCQKCNSRLGWYENNREVIDLFLQRGL